MTVAFTAGLTNAMTNLGPNQNIVFDHVETNIGNGYNSHHGVFVAPVSGIYVFYASLLSVRDTTLFCNLFVDGIKKVTIFDRVPQAGSAQGSQMLVIHLNQGADVAVKIGYADHSVYGDNANFYTTFSGFLLHQSDVDLIG
jgi:hypothetical protein